MPETTRENLPIDQPDARPDVRELISQLRALLPPEGRKIGADTAAEVARRVNLVAAHALSEPDDTVALECQALVCLAARKGSKEAAKRKPRASRWLATAPPSLSVLSSTEEKQAAVAFLTATKAPWVRTYAFAEAAAAATSKEVAGDLIRWAYASCRSTSEFVSGLAHVLEEIDLSAERVALLFTHSLKALGTMRAAAGGTFPDAFLDLATAVARYCEQRKAGSKERVALQRSCLALFDVITSMEPALLLAPPVPEAMAVLSQVGQGWSASAEKVLTSMAFRILSIALMDAQLHGAGGASDVRAALQAVKELLPVEKTGKRFAEQCKAVAELLQPDGSDGAAGNAQLQNQAAQDLLAALLPAWDGVEATLPDRRVGNEVRSLINALADAAKLGRIGEPGATETYHPLQHFLTESGHSPPYQVRITVPGVKAIRPDGTYRVLIKALAVPVT